MQEKSMDELRDLIVNSSSKAERKNALAEIERRANEKLNTARYTAFQQERTWLMKEFQTCSAQFRGNLKLT